MPDQTPEQLAKRIATGIFHCQYDESVQLARAYTDLHAEVVRLREALKLVEEHGSYFLRNIARAALSGSSDSEAEPKAIS